MTCIGVLERGERDKNNETSLKEEGGIEMSTTVLSIYAMHALFRFVIYLRFRRHRNRSKNNKGYS